MTPRTPPNNSKTRAHTHTHTHTHPANKQNKTTYNQGLNKTNINNKTVLTPFPT